MGTEILNTGIRDGVDRRHFLAVIASLLPLAVSRAADKKEKKLFAEAARLVNVTEQWGADDLYKFLNALPDEGRLSLKKALGMLNEKAEVGQLKGLSQDVYDIRQKALWVSSNILAYPFRKQVALNYHELVRWVASKAGVAKSKIKAGSTFALEIEIQKSLFAKLWDKMSQEQRLALLEKIDPNGAIKDRAAIAALGGAGALGVLSATVAFSGFAFYTAMSVTISTVAGFFGLTLPFAVYTSASSLVAFLSGPVGWTIMALAALGGLALAGRANVKKTTAFICQVHALKVAALLEAGILESEAFPPSVKYPGGGRLEANRDKDNEWEEFKEIDNGDGTYSFSAYTGFLCAEDGGGGNVVANRDRIGDWEKWRLERHTDGTVSLRTLSGYYLCAEPDGTVVANRDKVGPWEKFTLITRSTSHRSIKSWHGKFLSAQPE